VRVASVDRDAAYWPCRLSIIVRSKEINSGWINNEVCGLELAAWGPLEDAKWALRRLEDTEDAQEFRVLWAAAVVLLRAVGHVLKNVDGRRDTKTEDAIAQQWLIWKSKPEEHRVFWGFIDKERNTVLKEYEFGFELDPRSLVLEPSSGGAGGVFDLPDWIYIPFLPDEFEGEDARDLAQDAVDWWSIQLNAIERIRA
jgi:hypothetical protein